MQNIDISTVVFAVVALIVVLKLRSVLGMRNDGERPPGDASAPLRSAKTGPAVVTRIGGEPAGAQAAGPVAADRWTGVAEPGSPVWNGLDAIAAADRGFNAQAFLAGARAAYEMIVMAFAAGDAATLRRLLAPEVFDNFDAAIKARNEAGQTMTTTLIAIDAADIVEARPNAAIAQVGVRFAAKLASKTEDRSGAIVDGSADAVVQHLDIWTFARDVRSPDPNWRLSATQAVH